MIKCLAIDDEPLALSQLKTYIGKVPFLELVDACQSPIAAMKVLAEQPVDAIFLDINMPDFNGLSFVRSLVHQPLVVFTTAYSEYAIEGYKVDAVDYLLKPFGLDDFQRAANKVLQQFEMRKMLIENIASPAPKAEKDYDDILFVKTEYKVVSISISKIRYVEAMSEYLRLYMEDESKPIVALLSMKKLEERLPSNFMRVHRSYIVNLQKILEVARGRILMDEKTHIPVGDSYKDAFNDYLEKRSLIK